MTEALAWKRYLASRGTPCVDTRAEQYLLAAFDINARLTAGRFVPDDGRCELMDAADRLMVCRAALLAALRTYNPDQSVFKRADATQIKFRSYAIRGMRNALYVARYETDVLTRNDRLTRRNMARAETALRQEGQDVTDEALSARTGMLVRTIRQTNAAPNAFSPMKDGTVDGEADWHEAAQQSLTMECPAEYADPAKQTGWCAQTLLLADVLGRFAPREQEILRLRIGEAKSLRQTADVVGCTAERVRQIELKIYKSLRRSLPTAFAEQYA